MARRGSCGLLLFPNVSAPGLVAALAAVSPYRTRIRKARAGLAVTADLAPNYPSTDAGQTR